MTLEDIRAMTDDWITPVTAGKVMKMNPGRIIEYARTGQLPFACRISGNRVLISRKSFLETYYPEPKKKPDTPDPIAAELHTIALLLTAILMEVDPDFTIFRERLAAAQ